MKLAVQVNEGPYQHQATDSAYHFTKAALEKGHEVFRVFFYHDGVNNGTRLTTPPQDDRNIVNRWTELAEKYDLDLVLCVAAAQRRGLVGGGVLAQNGQRLVGMGGQDDLVGEFRTPDLTDHSMIDAHAVRIG